VAVGHSFRNKMVAAMILPTMPMRVPLQLRRLRPLLLLQRLLPLNPPPLLPPNRQMPQQTS
jgi:hypothetical protein